LAGKEITMAAGAGTLPNGAGGAAPAGLSNSQARQILVSKALTMIQNIYSGTVFPPSNPVIQNLIPRNVGVIKKFVIEVVGTITNTDETNTLTLTDTGLSNLISNVTFYDLNNNLRINTTGLHLTLLSTAKRRRPFAATAGWNAVDTTTTKNLSQMFNVPPALWPVLQGPLTIAAGASATVRAVFEVPIAYTDEDLRGAIFANVINSTMNLQITLNPTAVVNTGVDSTYATYAGAAGNFTSATVNVYQVYLDQLPVNPQTGKLILPTTDLSTVYELKNTTFPAFTVGQDNPIPFTNFRNFFSVFVIWNENGTTRNLGSDINYFSLQTANFTNIFKYDPLYAAMIARDIMSADLPAGIYYFSFRRQPIWTTQYGNMQINLNPSSVANGAYANAMWEDMALQNTLSGASSLPG
jgi:hypothetical protein